MKPEKIEFRKFTPRTSPSLPDEFSVEVDNGIGNLRTFGTLYQCRYPHPDVAYGEWVYYPEEGSMTMTAKILNAIASKLDELNGRA